MKLSSAVYFNPAFEGRSWHEPTEAQGGTHHVGPLGLLGLLETCLGLSGNWPSLPERTASLAGTLAAIPEAKRGFWKKSFEADRLGVARELLRWSDKLKMAGWNGQASSGRLAELGRLAADIQPGVPERLSAVLQALETSPTETLDIDKLFVSEPSHDLPQLWRNILQALGNRGVGIAPWSPENTTPTGNLLALRETGFTPKPDDDSLVLLHPQTIWEAAEHVAGWLAADSPETRSRTVIIGATPELDVALSRHGLPTSGAERKGASAAALANLLPLVVAIAEDVPDPEQVLEFLFLPQQPLPRPVARKLVRSLHEFPGVGHAQWQEALEKAVERIAEDSPDRATRVRSQAARLFSGELPNPAQGIPKGLLKQRFEEVLIPWLKQSNALNKESASHAALLALAEQLVRLIEEMAPDTEEISLAQLRKLTARIAEQSGNALHSAEATLHFVDAPEAIQGAADRIVWWNFTAETVPPLDVLPLSPEELDSLARNGCNLHDYFENCSSARAQRWWRPLRSCARQAILVAPERAATGELAARHPLWDEIEAKIHEGGNAGLLCRTDGIAPGLRTRKVPQAPRRPRRDWALPNLVGARETDESPSGMEAMLQCPFKWAMRYHARLSEPLARKLPDGGLLEGKLFHEIFRRICEDLPLDADPGRKASELFDEFGQRLAAPLFRPGAEGERERLRKKIVECTDELFRRSGGDGSRIEGSELELCGTIADQGFKGRLDLLLRGPTEIIDMKNSKSDREKQMKEGTAVQLTAYAHLLKESTGRDADVAYFILNSRQLLPDEDCGNGVEGWQDIENTYAESLTRIGTVLAAAGIPDRENEVVEKNVRENGEVLLKPACKYCLCEILCGRNELEEDK